MKSNFVMQLVRIPGIARVMITLPTNNIIDVNKIYVYGNCKPIITEVKYKKVFQCNLLGGILGVAQVMITL